MPRRMEQYSHCMSRLEESGCKIGKSKIKKGFSSTHFVIEHRLKLPEKVEFGPLQNELNELARHSEKSSQTDSPLHREEGNCFFRFEVSPLSEGFTPEERDELSKLSELLSTKFYVQRRMEQGVDEKERLEQVEQKIAFREPRVREILGLKL